MKLFFLLTLLISNLVFSGVILGKDCSEEVFPASLAVLTIENGIQTSICGGTLIAPDVVLTAAHCVVDSKKTYFVTAIQDLTEASLPSISGEFGTYALIHGSYNSINQKDDIALIILRKPLLIPPAKIISEQEAQYLKEGSSVQIVGWGRRLPKSIKGPEIIKKTCSSIFIQRFDPLEFQVGSTHHSPRKCFGDSGSATYFQQEDTGEWLVIGITSHLMPEDHDCWRGGIDLRVDPYLSWIKNAFKAACDSGARKQEFC